MTVDTNAMRERAESWLRDTTGKLVIDRDKAIGEENLALDVVELLDERDQLAAKLAEVTKERDHWSAQTEKARISYGDEFSAHKATKEQLSAANAEIGRLHKESDDLSRYHLDEFARYKRARNEQHERYDVLHAQFTAAKATLAEKCVEHVELNGHIDIAVQCLDYLAHAITDDGDPSGKLRDFADSLRIVIDQCDRQRRRANWYEAAHEAGKGKLIEHAVEKALSGARAAAHVYAERVDALGLAADDNDPKVMETAGPIGVAQADLFAALGLFERDASGEVVTKPAPESIDQLRAERDSARMLAEVRGKDRDTARTLLDTVTKAHDDLAARLNTPHTANFVEAVCIESAHQVQRWGVGHDAGKRAEDWIALVAYLLGKATKAHYDNDHEKLLHHIITVAAVCANWHANLTGADTRMRQRVAPRCECGAPLMDLAREGCIAGNCAKAGGR